MSMKYLALQFLQQANSENELVHNIPDHCTLLGFFLESYLFREILTFELKIFTVCIGMATPITTYGETLPY